ncbi:MAG: hypothetical protein WBO97_14360 [Tepidiformaceae bacterium]
MTDPYLQPLFPQIDGSKLGTIEWHFGGIDPARNNFCGYLPWASMNEVAPAKESAMENVRNPGDWTRGFEAAIDEAIRVVDALRGPTTSGLAAPILLRIRAELIALREPTPDTEAA